MIIIKRLILWALCFYVFVDLVYDYVPGAWQYDKIWHFTALFSYALALLTLDAHKIGRFTLIAISPIIFEVIQIWIPSHGFEWADMGANYLGTITAIILYFQCQVALTILGFKSLKI